MVDDIAAIEVDVLDESAAIVAVKNDVLVLASRTPAFDHDADRIRRPDWRVRDIWRNEKRFALTDEMINDPVAFADAHFDVAFELIKIFLGIDEMKIVPGVWTFDHHDEKIAAIVEVAIADRRFKQIAVRFYPVVDVDRWQYLGRGAAANGA
jgi:hypothetical protein